MKIFSPAKLNLFFRVLRKREDGFHEIASLMQAISLGDTLTFAKSAKEQITASDPNLCCDHTNFIYQARTLFQKKTRYFQPFHIHIEKMIPMEGGLGGGSSNISTTLWALNKISGLNINEKELRKWSGEISSDAPFFFSSGTAYVTGKGEIIENMQPLDRCSTWLALPKGKGLSTPLVYRHCIPNINKIDPVKLLEGPTYLNDLEPAAFHIRPDLANIKKKLYGIGFKKVVMTGSGSAFCCFGDITPYLSGVRFLKTSYISRHKEWYVTNSR